MLQSVSAHLMDERRGSTRHDRRRSTYGHSSGSPAHHSHHNFLMPPQPVSWVGTQIIQDFQPTTQQPDENPIGWAIFNPLPIRAPIPRPRLRQIQIAPDHVTARWEGANINSQSALLDADDGATVITDTIKDDQDDKEPKSCPQQTVKYIKILTPHVILVSVLIGYLCLGAWILMLLETRTELLARSKKLVRLTNLMSNFTAESWKMLNNAQHGVSNMDEGEWAATFREWMVRVSETVDDRRPIRRELNRPDDLSNMHNKWTFPTAILYVLTVLTTCGYGEVSVDTDVGKVFSVAFALVGIPLMFITAADIGKFLSETLLQFVSFWNRSVRKVKQWMSRIRHGRRKSLQSTGGPNDTLDILGVDGTEEKLWFPIVPNGERTKLWFPIGAYVSCICIYCSIGSAMFITWERTWSFIHAFHFGFNLIVTVGLGDIVVTDYIFLSLIVAFVIVGLSVVTMCVDLASTHLKAYFTRIHYFGRAKRFLGMSEELKEIVALLGAMRRKKGGKVTWNDVRDFLDNELRDRPFEPHELLMKLRFIDETSSGMSTIRHNSFQSDFFRESEYIRRVAALRPEQPAYL
ncbi:Potassium channel domain-containing protein [Caenorhabditis elegans]|uniref:Potassium channel domain-containing protein n=1 Tax=Caenorhabditis elegans TaxID=6239 RepID=A0A4V0IKI8_CAEEL|nr:Potassium channel domain-containing protein [Caenorhabditis elegans]VTW47617.1 Potassium channel domain-containing protein [Caenorhabditis elegans]